ncbi:MAG: stage III sporulation protein AC [Clostridia bacterium]|nr:stage III sporulation protein AC [Clostridia bacterium]
MEVDLIFQIAGVGIIVAVMNVLLSRSGRDEQALMITIAGLVVVLMIVVTKIGQLFETVKTVFGI